MKAQNRLQGKLQEKSEKVSIRIMENVPKLKEMAPKDRPAYIWEYYKWPIIIAIVIVIAVIYIVRTVTGGKDEIGYLMAVNADASGIETDNANGLFDDFVVEQGYDPEKSEITLNDALFHDPKNTSDIYSLQSIQTIIAANVCDVYVSDEDMFNYMAAIGYFVPVSEYLTEEQMEKYKDDIVWVTCEDAEIEMAWDGESSDPGTKYARGIRVKNSKWMDDAGLYPNGDPVIALVTGSDDTEMGIKMILYILGEDVSAK